MARRTSYPTPEIGTYEISTGTAEILADDLRPGGFVLHVNGVPSSYIVPGEPGEMEFEYLQWMGRMIGEIVEYHVPAERLRVTHLGGAGCSLARFVAHHWPQARNSVVEVDAKLAELVREQFDIPRSPTVKIRVGEARAVTDSFHPHSRDVIVRDVFSGSTTPHSLTTVEFFASAHEALAPGGWYLANCGTHADFAEARAEMAGMREVFEHLAVIADPPMLKGRRYGNLVLIASDTPIEISPAMTRDLLGGAMPAHVKGDEWCDNRIAGAPPRHDEGV
ncbi:spermidine synthase [Corynebacterium yudongzhengii]|uniref:Spermidine synthase n=1 Tax=Corynebacterium yudongzhengii TaxID=2080740 RepID=A0A2U1T9N1_9CORY|nr:fused MFS/spermidine synthase [Corynebacterium yudongzhengii]AWB82084.1 spermidine synthase [Corynebacterium yudongzhengii]PWC02588.1 spermidine synthase [Corynebacterium yudongzhengii]